MWLLIIAIVIAIGVFSFTPYLTYSFKEGLGSGSGHGSGGHGSGGHGSSGHGYSRNRGSHKNRVYYNNRQSYWGNQGDTSSGYGWWWWIPSWLYIYPYDYEEILYVPVLPSYYY
jgi:hypothetical protein